MNNLIKVTKKYDYSVSDERIEINGKVIAGEKKVPLVRFSIRKMADYKEVLFYFSAVEPAL